jgi:teichuronic acid biosynthesis glycosyltransferase TuaG
MISVCMPIQKDVRPRTMQDLITLRDFCQAAGLPVDVLIVEQEASHTARNLLTRRALDSAATHLLWIDADMSFPRDALLRLLAHRLPIVGGLYFNRRAPFHPQLLRKQPADRAMDDVPMAYCYDWQREVSRDGAGALFRVDATGAGFLLVERRVFTDISTDDGWWAPLGTGSDDIWFLRRVTAAGYEIFVDTALELGHLGEIAVDAEFSARNRIRRTNNWSPLHTVTPGRPVASIVIPVMEGSPTFRQAAISSAATQTVPVEVLVVAARTFELDLETLPANARLVRAPSGEGGVAHLLNSGIREAQTDWIAWLGDTDLMMPEKIEAQLSAAETAHVLALFHHYMIAAGDEYRRVPPPPQWSSILGQRHALGAACWIHGATTLIHQSVLNEVGPFDETLQFAFDWDLWNRIAQVFFWHYLPESLGFRREPSAAALSSRSDGEQAQRIREDAEIRRRYAAVSSVGPRS